MCVCVRTLKGERELARRDAFICCIRCAVYMLLPSAFALFVCFFECCVLCPSAGVSGCLKIQWFPKQTNWFGLNDQHHPYSTSPHSTLSSPSIGMNEESFGSCLGPGFLFINKIQLPNKIFNLFCPAVFILSSLLNDCRQASWRFLT